MDKWKSYKIDASQPKYLEYFKNKLRRYISDIEKNNNFLKKGNKGKQERMQNFRL